MKQSLKKGISWGLYDFANSGYFLVFVVLTFPLFLSQHIFPGDRWFEAKWGVTQGAAILLAVVIGLSLGRRLDKVGIQKVVPWCIRFAGVMSLLIPLLIAFKASGNILLFIFAIVHATYLFSLTVYDASLKGVATGLESVEVSGWAWGWGYMGGIACMIIMLIVGKLSGENPTYIFFTASLFYLVSSLLSARGLKHRITNTIQKISQESEVKQKSTDTLMLSTNRWRLLLTFVLVVDGIAVFMGFFSIYANKIVGATDSSITAMLGVLQLLAFPLTGLLVSLGSSRYGLRKLLLFCGLSWSIASALVVLFPTVSILWVCVFIIAGAVGTTQALLRSLYADTVPETGSIHGFSTYAIVEKGAAFIGPLVGGSLISVVGYKPVLLVAGLMILLGCISVGRLVKVKI